MSIRSALHLTNVSWKVTILVAVSVGILYAPNVLSEDIGIDFITLLILCPLSAVISFVLIISALVACKTKMAAGLLVSGITVILMSFDVFTGPVFRIGTDFHHQRQLLLESRKRKRGGS